MPRTPHRLQLLYFPECPHWSLAEKRLREVADRCGLSIEHQLVTTEDDAERVSFRGSPTILIDGVDPFAEGDQAIGLSCRIYRTPDGYAGSPTSEQIAAALGRE
ncbi:MAG: thioredoxin family protein [Acidimicrobiia bacterium]